MVNCFAPDYSHHSESHHDTCKFFRFPASDGPRIANADPGEPFTAFGYNY